MRELPAGGSVVLPVDAVPGGAELQIETSSAPAVPDGMTGLSDPVDLRFDTGAQPEAPVTLTYPYDPSRVPEGEEPSQFYGISTYDDAASAWEALPVRFDPEAGTYSTELTSFSWKWPWQVDWTGIGAQINQTLGEVAGKRAAAASCTSGAPLPSWARAVVSNDPAISIRTCAEGDPDEPDVAVVQVVNNRPYGVLGTSPVDLASMDRDGGGDVPALFTAAAMDAAVDDRHFYIPAGGSVTVGFTDDGWTEAQVVVAPTEATLVVDVVAQSLSGVLAGRSLDALAPPIAQKCLTNLVTGSEPTGAVITAGTVRSWILGSSGCLQQALLGLVGSGVLDGLTVDRLDKTYKALGRFGVYSKLFSTEWNAFDLIVDQLLVDGDGTFTVSVTDPTIITTESVAAFAGTWSGPVDQPFSRPYSNVTTFVVDGPTGETVAGTVSYPGLGCSGTLSRFRLKNGALLATERIDRDPRFTCIESGRVTFTPRPDGTLRYGYQSPSIGNGTRGILTRG